MKILLKFIRENFNTRNLSTLGGIIFLTSTMSNSHIIRNVLISVTVYFIFCVVMWCLSEYKIKIICEIFGHKWVYNFNTLPNKCICPRCNQKQGLDLETLEWVDVDEFSPNLGTDDEIIKRWSKNK